MHPRPLAAGPRTEPWRPRLAGVPVPARALGIGAGWLDLRSGSPPGECASAEVIDLTELAARAAKGRSIRGHRRQGSRSKSEVA